VTAFYNEYDELRAVEPRPDLATLEGGYLRVPSWFVNAVRGQTHGFEVAANWQATEGWRLQLVYSYLRMKLKDQPGFSEPNTGRARRFAAPPSSFAAVEFRYPPRSGIRPVATLRGRDARAGRRHAGERDGRRFLLQRERPSRLASAPGLELSLVGTNLLGPSHVEFVQETYPFPEQVERSVYGQIKWSF
jgi:iron complex outermembrane receptor protein